MAEYGQVSVFISYSRRDEAAVRSLAEDFARAHQQVWLDQELGGGDAWWPEILTQIRACTVFVFAVSNHALRSKPCRAELGYAEALGLPILPVQIGQVSTHRADTIFAKQLVDYRNPTRTHGIDLITALHERELRRNEVPDPLPEPPPIPYEYLLRLGATVRGEAELSSAVQAATVFELREALDSENDDEIHADIRELLRTMRGRREVTYAIAREINTILGDPAEAASGEHVGHPAARPASGGPRHDQGSKAAGKPYLQAPSDRRYLLEAVATRIGRLSDNDIVLDDDKVSRHHAVIVHTSSGYAINDLHSANGVNVEHQRIQSSAVLNDGDHINIGNTEFTFHRNSGN